MNLMSVSLPKTREVGALVYSQPLLFRGAPSWNLHPGFVRFRRAKDGHCHKYIEDLCTKKKTRCSNEKKNCLRCWFFLGVLQSFLGGALHLLTLEGHERLLRVVQRLKLCPKLHKTLLTKWFTF